MTYILEHQIPEASNSPSGSQESLTLFVTQTGTTFINDLTSDTSFHKISVQLLIKGAGQECRYESIYVFQAFERWNL